MGRGDLIRGAVVLAVLVAAAPAGAAGKWRQIGDGPTTGAPATRAVAYVALSRAGTAAFAGRLGAVASKLGQVRWATTAVVAVLADWGCSDDLVSVGRVAQKGATLHVLLVQGEPPAGAATYQALFGVYRLLAVQKSVLHSPYPTRAVIDVA
jgi:hypothetical protein